MASLMGFEGIEMADYKIIYSSDEIPVKIED